LNYKKQTLQCHSTCFGISEQLLIKLERTKIGFIWWELVPYRQDLLWIAVESGTAFARGWG